MIEKGENLNSFLFDQVALNIFKIVYSCLDLNFQLFDLFPLTLFGIKIGLFNGVEFNK